MPTYQYTCTDCGNALEAVQKFTDDALTVCPSCGGNLRKVFSAVGVVFKGSGFYRTDNRTSSSQESSKATSTTSTEPKKSESKSEGKSETKTESKPKTEGKSSTGASASKAA